jgi:hypothetical protein
LNRTLGLTAVIAFSLAAGVVAADPPDVDYRWDHPNEVRVSSAKVAFSHTKYKHAKNESIYIMGYFSDGWVFMFNLFHMDTLLFDRWGAYALVGEPDGTSHWKTATPKSKNVLIEEDHLRYFDGVNLLEDSDGSLRLKCDFGDFSCDLKFDKYLAAWKPGSGRENYTENGEYFQYKAVFMPWSEVTGTIGVDGQQHRVEGFGYGEKTLFVNSLTRFQPYLHALRLYTPIETPREESWHIGILHATLNKAYGDRELPRLVVARGDEWLFTTRDYAFEPLKTARLDTVSYEYATAFKLHAQKDGYIVDGIVEERVFIHFTDVFESLPLWVRNILMVFFKRPVYFRYISDFTGTITGPDGTVQSLDMSGPYEYVVVY